MKTEEDEAFDDLAKRQGDWGGGFTAKRKMAADKLWDKPSVAFDEWWNGDNDESTNPFRLESGAYWAWAGWKAALAQPAQSVAGYCKKIGELIAERDSLRAALAQPPQRKWVGLTPEDILALFDEHNLYGSKLVEFARAVETKIKDKNT